MSYLFLIPVSIALGLTGLSAFFWSMRHNQYEDLDGAAARILTTNDQPLLPPELSGTTKLQPDAGLSLTAVTIITDGSRSCIGDRLGLRHLTASLLHHRRTSVASYGCRPAGALTPPHPPA